MRLAAHHHVFAALDHVTRAAAVLVGIAQAVRFQIIDEHGLTAGDGNPGIGPATVGVAAGIAHAQRGPAIDLHIGRAGFRRADADMRTSRALVVVVRGHFGIVAEPRLRANHLVENIPQTANGGPQ
jgi:hypothetical protein